MSRNYIVLGTAPLSEPVFFDNEEWTKEWGKSVLVTYAGQLKREFPTQAHNITIIKDDHYKSFVVVIQFIDEKEDSWEIAKNIADQVPYCWDEISQKNLGKQYFRELKQILCNHTPFSEASVEAEKRE